MPAHAVRPRSRLRPLRLGPLELPPAARTTAISALVQKQAEYVRPWFNLSLAFHILSSHGITDAPIVDEDGVPIGVFSCVRAAAALAAAQVPSALRVRDLAPYPAVVMSCEGTVAEAITRMPRPTPPIVCAVDDAGVLTGVISVIDIARWVVCGAPTLA